MYILVVLILDLEGFENKKKRGGRTEEEWWGEGMKLGEIQKELNEIVGVNMIKIHCICV